MKILMVIGQFYPMIGGAERQCLKLSKALTLRGHVVKVLTVWDPRNVPQYEQIEGILVERVWYPVITIAGYRVGFGFLAPLAMFWSVLKESSHVDVIHAHQCLWPAFVATLAARMRGRSIICKIGNSGERFDLHVLRKAHVYGRIAAWHVKKHITKFVWTSKAVKSDLLQEGIPEKQLVSIPNGVVLPSPSTSLHSAHEIYNGMPEQRRRPTTAKIIFIFTGTFTLKKNLLTLIKAIQTLPSSYRSVMHMMLLGDGPDRAALHDAVRHYGMHDSITMPRSVDDVGDYLQRSDVFVLPSFTEGLSNSALEAMAYGLPVILSNRGGNSDLVDGNGLLIDPMNTQSLADAIQFMVDHPEERKKMGQQSRKIVEERYAMDKVVQQHEALYKALAS